MSKDWAAARELWKNKAPMKRGAQPEEIAHVASMLINSTYLTGEIILSDGGLNLT
jgi:NAD(P)-dependent dehydrogenase (short-subunit alcohol dehydrogenase family)